MPDLERCEKHNLMFDAQLYLGCVVCRREDEEARLQTSSRSRGGLAIMVGWGALAVLALGLAGRAIYERRHAARARASDTALTQAATGAPALRAPAPKANIDDAPVEKNPLPASAAGPPGMSAGDDILLAAELNDGRTIQRLLRKGVSINTMDPTGKSSLLTTSMRNPDLAVWLIQEGADVTLGDPKPFDRLGVRGAEPAYTWLTLALVERGVDLEKSMLGDDVHAPLLFHAAMKGNVTLVRGLLAHGAKVDTPTPRDSNALTYATHARPEAILETMQLLIDHGAAVTPLGAGTSLPIIWASARGEADAVRLLILNGANPNYRPADANEGWNSPLVTATRLPERDREAAEPKLLATVKVLLKMGADPHEAVGFFDHCPHCYDCCPPVGEDLIREAASRGPTPLRLDATDEGGNTYLHFAASLGSPGLVKKLLAAGLDASAKSNGPGELSRGYQTGSTPLHIAAARCDAQTVIALLSAKASTTATDGAGKLPSDVACMMFNPSQPFENREVVAQLLPRAAGRPR